ncbi:MAG TPA: ribonuclease P protein component [Thermoanaerobaculia bacterium]|nr:ribonuclease P protein component [Thermoanaerobaculia bacterium]
MTPRAAPEGFPKEARLRKRRDFTDCQKRGRRVAGRWLVIFALDNALGRSRWGLSVPKKVGSAVVRNRVKRRLREIVRRTRGPSPARDLCILARPGASEASIEELSRELDALSRRLPSSPSSARTSG